MAGSFTTPEPDELADLFPQLDILELIGAGGMGVVYKARQRELDRIVALKILPPGIGDDPDFAERFTREAKALAMLNHPGIVTIHDTGRAGGLYFLLMEFIDGLNLQQLLRNGRISPREALAIVPQVCDALQYAHDAGIVHRDIKPENILLDRQGRVKVADFGIVKLMGVDETESADKLAATPRFTQAGLVMGTPQYMAPEQFERPTEVDHRADIYSLGVVLYQMLTGELPGSLLEPPSRKVDLDIHLDEIVLRALEKDPERRYQRIDDVRTVMETLITPTNQPPPVTMDIHFACPSCNQKLSVEPSAAGQEFTCPACSAPIVAPSQQKPVLLTSASPPSGQPLASTAPTAPRPPAIPPPAKRARGLAIWALVLGIIGIIPVVGLATALLAGVLGVVALMKKTTSKGLAIAGTVLGAIGVLMIPVHILILTSAVGGMKFAAGTTVCLTNLKQIGTAIASYQQKHNGQYPDRLETLEKEGLISPKILQCPLHKGGSGNCYDYSRPAGPGASGMLAWDRHPHKTNDIMIGRNVLFDDLSVRMLPEQEFKQSPKAGRQAVRSTPLVVPSVSTRPHVGTRPEVRERPKPEPTPPVEKVMTLASVLEDLKSAQPREMRPLLEFLKDAPASDEHRPQVIQAMKPLLDDVDAGNMAFEVFLHWAGNEQIPDFIEFLRVAPKSPRGKEAMKFLSRTGDERAAEPLAACLADFFTSRDAKAALAALGEVAKPALLPYYHHQDRGVREAARELLRGYHATEEETFAETLKALQNGSTGSRQSAIFDLTAAPLKPEQQLAACRALHPLVTDDERSISDGSRKAMIALATKEDADFLLGLMDSPDDRTRQFATDVLIKLKEPRVAQPLAMQLADPRKTHAAGRALISLGSVAEPAVFPLLKDSELNTRKRAAEVLGEIGTKASLPELEKIARNKKQDNFFARVAAERAIAAIKSRPPNDR